MKPADDLLLIPHEEGFRAWRAKGDQISPLDADGRVWKNASWVALPARSIVSVPMRIQGADGERRESAAQLELEAAGFGQETSDAHSFELQTLPSGEERDAPVTALIQAAALPENVLAAADHARFVPSVAFHELKPREVLLWYETGGLVMAIPNAKGSPIHCQGLSARVLDADAAAEVRCVLAALDLAGVLPELESICIASSHEAEDQVPVSFENGLDLPVTTRRAGPPVMPGKASRLVPQPVVQLRVERQQRRMVMMGVAAFTLVLIAALGAFALRVLVRERSLIAEQARLRGLESQLESIREARANWEDLRPALRPDLYPVETIYQLVQLLPPEGIRVTRFELKLDAFVIDGEASSLGHGIEFRDKLVAAPALSHWVWDVPQPTSLPDGRATFRAEAKPKVDETITEEGQEVTSL